MDTYNAHSPEAVQLAQVLERFANACYKNSVDHGFWDHPCQVAIANVEQLVLNGRLAPEEGEMIIDMLPERNKGEMMMLMTSEIGEMLEGVRKSLDDEHLPDFTSEEVEAADLFIRLMDYVRGHNLRFTEAVIAKFDYNKGRPFKHSSAF